MTTTHSVLAGLIDLLATQLELDPAIITEESDLFDGLGIDSTGIIDLLLALEERFEIEFDMEELDPSFLATVKSLSDYIVSLKE